MYQRDALLVEMIFAACSYSDLFLFPGGCQLHSAILATSMGRSLSLGDLPSPALDRLMEHLGPTDLVHLHVATGTAMPAIQQQVNIMRVVRRCAHHWLRLSQRVLPPSKQGLRSQISWAKRPSPQRQIQRLSVPCSKHQLLEDLRSQISHVNDVAALVYHWSSCQLLTWGCQKDHPGIDQIGDLDLERLEALNAQIHHALSLCQIGYLCFYGNMEDPDNKASEFTPFGDDDVQYHLEFSDQLLFVCALYRLQQLHTGAVLARLHGIFSRCCRHDLLLASRVLCLDGTSPFAQAEYQASRAEKPSADILTAFGQSEPYVKEVVSLLTAVQRERMMACVQTMVDT